jgi:RHS repeat-associated protein
MLERQFLWDQGQLLAELDSAGTHRIAQYSYWPGIDAPFALVTGAQSIASTRYFALDETQNVAGVFTSAGVTQSLTYTPFGTLDSAYIQLGMLADTNRLRWKGLPWEGDSTQLYYVRNRWYDPLAQRFTSEDPIGLAGGINPYVFGADDPINKTDPTGLDYCVEWMTSYQEDAGGDYYDRQDYWEVKPMFFCGGEEAVDEVDLPYLSGDGAVLGGTGGVDNPALDRANAIIRGVAADTKGFNQLMNCAAASGLAGFTIYFDLDFVKDASLAALHAVTFEVSQGLAYRTAMHNIAGQDAVASVVQRAASTNAKVASDETKAHLFELLGSYSKGMNASTIASGTDMSSSNGQFDSSFWKDLVPGMASARALGTAQKVCTGQQ